MLKDLKRLRELAADYLAQSRVVAGLVRRGELEALEESRQRQRRAFHRFQAWHRRLLPRLEELAGRDGELMAGLRRDLAEALELDRQALRRLEKMRRQTSQDLARLKQGRRLVQAYRPVPPAGAGPDRLSRLG